MSQPLSLDPNGEIIDVGDAEPRRRRRWPLLLVVAAVILLFILGSRGLSIYISALWFSSLGYSAVFWYIFKIKLGLFLAFFVLTVLILQAAFWLVGRAFGPLTSGKRTVFINQQPVNFSPGRILRPLSWVVSIIAGLIFGLGMRESWRSFALYFHQAPTDLHDPIFNKPLGFYLFTLPVYDTVSSWVLSLAFVVLIAAVIYAVLAVSQQGLSNAGDMAKARKTSIAAVSFAIAPWLVVLAWRFVLSRYPYLWGEHQTFTGVTYVEANHLLPGYIWVAVALLIAAVISLVNAFALRRVRIMIAAIVIPIIVYVIGIVIIPAYVTAFIVKPNELARETPYITHNIAWTRRAFGIDKIEQRNFDVTTAADGLDVQNNRPTLDNIRLWDWRALQDTLKQIQAIRTYYDFPDVDVDRYQIGGQNRQVMIAARELNDKKLPESSRNWINEKLIYTHGFGATMNTATGFTPEGMPRFILSNMPIESTAPEIKITRPQIYYGQMTDTEVYVKTKQREFDFPQGDQNAAYTNYEGTGGIRVGGGLRRLLLAWALSDLSKLPFSDDVTSESRVLINRNIKKVVDGLAPFLIYDRDPYIVSGNDGGLYWMIDAYTETSSYPYSKHYQVDENQVNYIRNSVKVVIDAYNGTTHFYVFDQNDPMIATYRSTFPSLFRDASQMPADLRAHVRYPETLMRAQGEVFGLYHIQNTKVFFQQEDVWSVAQQVSVEQDKKQVRPIDPYYVLMQFPGEQSKPEFALIVPFTPANRNNMIGWMAGRCDGENYGKLLVYDFPKSRLIDGPLQIEARIDQNAQLSSQFTLWNQQGSRVVRGHLLVIPMGNSLLYVEPIYLRSENSPMPELRIVVLATQERLAYGNTFEEAVNNMFGESAKVAPDQKPAEAPPKPGATPQASPSPVVKETPNLQQLINRAVQEFEEYQRLTSQGKLAEAGKKLEEHKRTLEELKRASGQPK
jgi:uncharacterized protein